MSKEALWELLNNLAYFYDAEYGDDIKAELALKRAIERLFKNISYVITPFYGDIYILKKHIRSRSVSFSDGETEQHPIVSWWWNGIPRKLGIGLVI